MTPNATLERPALARPPEPDPNPPMAAELPAEIVFNGTPLVTEAPPPVETFQQMYERMARFHREEQAQRVAFHNAHLAKNHRVSFSDACPICLSAYYSCSVARSEYLGGPPS